MRQTSRELDSGVGCSMSINQEVFLDIFAGANCQRGQTKVDISLGCQSWVAVTGRLWNVFPFTCYTGTIDTEMTPGDKVISQ